MSEKEYLIDLLKKAGIKTPISETMKKLRQSNEIHIGAVLRLGESLQRSSSKKNFIDQEGQAKRRYKLWSRERTFRVVIADSKEDKCEAVLTEFLKIIDKGIVIDGNWIDITVGNPDWVDAEDSVLKSKMGVQVSITFTGGIYEDKDRKKIGVKVQIDKEGTDGNN